MKVAPQPAAGLDDGHAQLAVHCSLRGADQDAAGKAVHVGRGGGLIGEKPVDRCDVGGHLIPTSLNTGSIVAAPSSTAAQGVSGTRWADYPLQERMNR